MKINRYYLLSRLRGFVIPVLLVVAAMMTSCQREKAVRSALARAEAVMEENPGAARQILDSLSHEIVNNPNRQSIVNRKSSNRKSDLALWALLRTQADYKCNVRLTSDSLPLIATRYYGTKRKTQRAALAQHYLGCAYIDMKRDLEAMDALLRASTLFPDTTNKYFANNLFELGILYTNHHMLDSAWVAFSRYRQTAVCNSDSVNIGYADYYMGYVALRQGADDVADSLFHRVEGNTRTTTYNRFNTYFQLAKLYYYHKHDIEGAVAYLDKIGDYFGAENGAVLSLKADILAEQQQPALAYEFHKKAIKNSSDIYTQCSSYEVLASLAPLINKGDSTRFFIHEYKVLLDTIISRSQKEKIAEIKDKHIVEIHDQQMKARHARFMLWMGIGAVVLLSGIAFAFLLIDRKRKKRYLQIVEELRDTNVKVLQAQGDETPADMDAIYRSKLAACQNLFRRTSSARLLLMPPSSLTADQKQALMNDLTRSFVDIMLDVKNASNAVNDQELLYCILSSLQCSTAQMAELLNTTESTLRTRKTRMKEKMSASLFSLFF